MKLLLKNEADTDKLGRTLGRILKGGEVIELVGDIGAGKTTFAKGIAAGMSIEETVQSPTFTISRVYPAPSNLLLHHYDFYRLSDAGIMADELHEAANNPANVVVIEWGDIVRDVLPDDYLEVRFTAVNESSREVDITAQGARSERLLQEMTK